MKFNNGDKVYSKEKDLKDLGVGIVLNPKAKKLPKDSVLVKWEYSDEAVPILASKLGLVSEAAKEMQDCIDEATSAFEKAFKSYEKVREIQSRTGLYDLERDKLISMKKLESVVKEYGWSSSSLNC